MACDAQTLANLVASNKLPAASKRGLEEAIAAQAAQHGGNDALVTAWLANVAANGGAVPSANTVAALNTFCFGLRAQSLLASIIGCNCFVPDNLIAARTPLIFPASGLSLWANVGASNFAPADLSVAGLSADGSKGLNTGIVPSTVFTAGAGSYGVSVLVGAISVPIDGADLSTIDDAAHATALFANFNRFNIGYVWNNVNGQLMFGTSGPVGFFSMDRVGTVQSLTLISNPEGRTTLATNTSSDAISAPTHPFGCFCQNSAGSFNTNSNRTLSFAAVRFGMTGAQLSALFALVRTMRNSLGGGCPDSVQTAVGAPTITNVTTDGAGTFTLTTSAAPASQNTVGEVFSTNVTQGTPPQVLAATWVSSTSVTFLDTNWTAPGDLMEYNVIFTHNGIDSPQSNTFSIQT